MVESAETQFEVFVYYSFLRGVSYWKHRLRIRLINEHFLYRHTVYVSGNEARGRQCGWYRNLISRLSRPQDEVFDILKYSISTIRKRREKRLNSLPEKAWKRRQGSQEPASAGIGYATLIGGPARPTPLSMILARVICFCARVRWWT